MSEPRIRFIGAGNMARAIIAGLRRQGVAGEEIAVHAPHPERREALARDYGIISCDADAVTVAADSIVVYAAKPKQVETILPRWRAALEAGPGIFLSLAAGITSASLKRLLGPKVPVLRCMPNTPAQIGAGMTTLYADASVVAEHRRAAETVLAAVGRCLWLEDEGLMDAATALAGSGPAYVLLFLEALEDAGVLQGLPRATARTLAGETVLGAARLAQEADTAPSLLRHQVTSPAGTTAAALAVWEEGLRTLAQRAVQAAVDRSRALARATEEGKS
ncbi:pyrroline-5-carboxylate reductase [Acidithiobacillus sp.]|uniref:pyrroline-5-carboxylate reductase n=1 Tax=Acidithiobacillus sp. TaxID=1872118 RepID=UPI0025C33CD3|nr:pyrroline-5-carboxylate reductase [Acidithiobacillus sp.]